MKTLRSLFRILWKLLKMKKKDTAWYLKHLNKKCWILVFREEIEEIYQQSRESSRLLEEPTTDRRDSKSRATSKSGQRFSRSNQERNLIVNCARQGLVDIPLIMSCYKWELEAILEGLALKSVDEQEQKAHYAFTLRYVLNAKSQK